MRSERTHGKGTPGKKPAPSAYGPERAPTVPDLAFGQSVGYQVRMTNRAFQTALRERVAPFGVSAGMWYFLRLLWQHDGLTQGELGRRIGLMEPTAFTALTGMERRGLIRRVKNSDDRRKINVFLTPHGKALRDQMLPIAHEINEGGLEGLAKKEKMMLLDLLKRIESNLEKTDHRAKARND
jgi:MarR family transcriptional regulator, organic hydroperoxide resistance regulator